MNAKTVKKKANQIKQIVNWNQTNKKQKQKG